MLGGRSGTSATTGTLGLLGAALPRRLTGMSAHNPKGYFEPQAIADRHDQLLGELGSSWHDPRAVAAEWFQGAAAGHAAQDLTDLFRYEYGDAALCALKEPRMSRLLPLWDIVFRTVDVRPAFLFVWRHPMTVARSLRLSSGRTIEEGLLFCLRGALSAERATRSSPRLVLPFAGLLADWRGGIARLRASIAPGLPAPDVATEQQVDAFLDPRLNHQTHAPASMDEVASPSAAWAAAVDNAFGRLRDDPGDRRAMAELDAVGEDFDRATGVVGTGVVGTKVVETGAAPGLAAVAASTTL